MSCPPAASASSARSCWCSWCCWSPTSWATPRCSPSPSRFAKLEALFRRAHEAGGGISRTVDSISRAGERTAGKEARLLRLPHAGQEDGRTVLQGRGGQVPQRQGGGEQAGAQSQERQPGRVGHGADAAQQRGAGCRRQCAGEVDPVAEVRLIFRRVARV